MDKAKTANDNLCLRQHSATFDGANKSHELKPRKGMGASLLRRGKNTQKLREPAFESSRKTVFHFI